MSCRSYSSTSRSLGVAAGEPKKPLRGLQNLWHAECVRSLDQAIERGEPVEKTQRRHKTVAEYQWEQEMAERSKFMVNAIRARRQGCAPDDAIDDGDPLLALLDQFAEPDMDAERYEQLRDEVENQLFHEREWRDGSRGPRGPGGGLGR